MEEGVLILEINEGDIEIVSPKEFIPEESFVEHSDVDLGGLNIILFLFSNNYFSNVHTMLLFSKNMCSLQLTMLVGPTSLLEVEYFLVSKQVSSRRGLTVALNRHIRHSTSILITFEVLA